MPRSNRDVTLKLPLIAAKAKENQLCLSRQSLQRKPSEQIEKFDPATTKIRDSEADAVIAHAKRVKDWPMLERAIEKKIEEQIEFVAWWGKTVTPQHGAGRGKARTRSLCIEKLQRLYKTSERFRRFQNYWIK